MPDAVELQELALLFEQFGIIESLRLVRAKSCAFLNFCTADVAAALHAKFKLTQDAAPPEIHGKHLTVNFAKARPCDEAQLSRITDGARRTLRIVTPAHMDEDKLRSALGTGRAESIVHCESVPLTQGEGGQAVAVEAAAAAEVAPAAADAADAANGAGDAASTAGSSLAFVMSFSSVTAAISAKAALESLSVVPGPGGVALEVGTVSYVVTPVLSDEELAALIADAEAAAAAGAAAEEAAASAEKMEMGEELAELVEAAAASSASAAAAAVAAAGEEGSGGGEEASLVSAMDAANLSAPAAAPPS